MRKIAFNCALAALICIGCEYVDHTGEADEPEIRQGIALSDVARILAYVDVGPEQMREVHDAVSASSGNGYDEEYMMRSLFESPGAGVGDSGMTKSTRAYGRPLRDLISDYVRSAATKSSDPEDFLQALSESDIQIYWPFSEDWDGRTAPIITYDPCDGSSSNEGYRIVEDANGNVSVKTVVVDEELASVVPVWVVNRNDDSGFPTVEMLRREDPDWGKGGSLTIGTKSGDNESKALVLKQFTMLRNYDTWFAGASEFFIKCGSLEDFSASTEAELRLYSPMITDFMLVVRRHKQNVPLDLDIVLVSEWTDQLESCAFMITEDDGGTQTAWKCSGTVKIKSKSYGFDISIPLNSRDDIVWRGRLTSSYIEKYVGQSGHFGGVDLVFDFM